MSGKARLSVFLTAALVLEMGSSLVELEQSVARISQGRRVMTDDHSTWKDVQLAALATSSHILFCLCFCHFHTEQKLT